MGAAIAFYTVFSLGPSLFLMIAVAGLVSGAEIAQEAILGEVSGLIGQEGDQADWASCTLPTDRPGAWLPAALRLQDGAR